VAVGFTPENLERIASEQPPDIHPAIDSARGSHVLFREPGKPA
jgi:hypothetical protein